MAARNITKVNLIKVGHHGNLGHQQHFWNQIRPDYAVYSNRRNNSFFNSGGHRLDSPESQPSIGRAATANPNIMQYAIRDSGGILVVISSSGQPNVSALKEFQKEIGKPDYFHIEDAILTPVPIGIDVTLPPPFTWPDAQ